MTNYIKGIDTSIVQGAIDWQAVAAQDIKFSVMKCAQGNDGVDPNYKSNMAGAQAAGLYVASYHFVYPLPPLASQPGRDPVKQAQKHFSVADNTQPVFCDAEWPATQDWSRWGCSASQINDWLLQYLQAYEQLSGKKIGVYSYPYWAKAVGFTQDFAQYPYWTASYQQPNPAIPHPWTDWVMWQNTGGGGKLPNGAPVDTDLVKDLSLWGVSAPQTTGVSVPTVNTAPQTPAPWFPTLAPIAPEPIHPVNPPSQPDAVAPSPARPAHPVAPLTGWELFMSKLVGIVASFFGMKK